MTTDKQYISYNEIHQAIGNCVNEQEVYERFNPTLLIAIGSGGYIPGRMLRTFLKAKCGRSLPLQTIGLVLYDDDNDKYDFKTAKVRKTQWLNYNPLDGTGVSLQGHNILIIDEVDDTRKTLHFAVEELSKDVATQRMEYEAGRKDGEPVWQEPKMGVFVVHNKDKPKLGSLPEELLKNHYYNCQNVPDNWIVYPWDALDIYEHQALADKRIAAAKRTAQDVNGKEHVHDGGHTDAPEAKVAKTAEVA